MCRGLGEAFSYGRGRRWWRCDDQLTMDTTNIYMYPLHTHTHTHTTPLLLSDLLTELAVIMKAHAPANKHVHTLCLRLEQQNQDNTNVQSVCTCSSLSAAATPSNMVLRGASELGRRGKCSTHSIALRTWSAVASTTAFFHVYMLPMQLTVKFKNWKFGCN